METHEFPGDPTGQAVFNALAKNLPPEEAYNATESIRAMASANLIAQAFASFNEKFDSLRRELNTLKWVIGIGVAILATLMALLR